MLSINNLSGFGAAGGDGGDPYFSNVVLLLHMDGTDGSTTFTDVKGKTVTPNGNAQIDTAQSKFGGASGMFDGVGDTLSIPDHADFDFGTGDFTVEWWQRWNTIEDGATVYNHGDAAAGALRVRHNAGDSGRLSVEISGASVVTESAPGPSAGVWYHYAVTRSGTTLRIFRDGTEKGSAANSTNLSSTSNIVIADTNNCWLDDFRVTKGVARYTGAFTPPTTAHPDN